MTARLEKFSLSKARADFLAARPFKEFYSVKRRCASLPSWLDPPVRAITAPDPASVDQVAQLRAAIDAKVNQADPEDLGRHKTTHRQRRRIEHQLADYLEGHGILADKVQKMRCCRMHGNWGDRDRDGSLKPVIAWDSKCGEVRLCPDEARAEQRRLVRRYKPACLAWVKEKPTRRRIHKAVITWPNIAAGDLAEFKRRMFKEHAQLMKKFPVLRAALVSQEDPLAARGDWNLHLNALYLVEGKFDWADFRAAWHAQTAHLFPECASDFQMDLQQLPRFDERALEKAIIECIKYPVKHVTEKANEKISTDRLGRCDCDQDGANLCLRHDGQCDQVLSPNAPPPSDREDQSAAVLLAPALIEWPRERFMEWWSAGLKFRRTRSYGALFKIGDPEREPDLSEVRWRGRLWWDHQAKAYAVERAGAVSVDLIQGDKSGSRKARSDNFLGSGPGTGPPHYQ